jgi:hypothetical protein
MWNLWWAKWHWDRFFPPEYFGFSPVNVIPPVFHYMEKFKKRIIIIGLHNKPQGFSATVASAAGPFTPPPPKKKLTALPAEYRDLVYNGYLPRCGIVL